jgi:hypothetical protein
MMKTIPLPEPENNTAVSVDSVNLGMKIPAIEMIKIFSAAQWEDFISEWVTSLKSVYSNVERCGGSGDMGRDIIAFLNGDEGVWDNYQCKHYKDPISPDDIWLELGKLVYYTKRGDYTYPRKYIFVAPKGAGTKLSNLLKKPQTLREGLLAEWDKKCRKNISSTLVVELDREMKKYIEALDFSIFSAKPPLLIIEEHARTRWHVARFGGGLPPRPVNDPPPEKPASNETNYVRHLYDAYSDHLKRAISESNDFSNESHIKEHFSDSRIDFYSAESLRLFSRDILPPGEFEKLKTEIHVGIKDEIRSDHLDGYKCVVSTVKTARSLHLSSHSLLGKLTMSDRGGICHQLANDNIVKWIK